MAFARASPGTLIDPEVFMNSERWNRIQSLFHEAAEQPESSQLAFLESACGGDQELLSEVIALLEEDREVVPFLDRDFASIASQVLDSTDSGPRKFGPYQIIRLLGQGGMGTVYLAERADLGSQVAIKFLRDAWMSPARRDRFAIEQRTLARLNHPGIARLYDAGVLADGTPWFVMEYVDGLPLDEYCRANQCSIEQRLALFRSVCEAVQYAHQHAIIHRDLKPSNILVKSDGTVRLLDFGIAKQLDNLDQPADQTRTELRLMTPAYAAPEQLRGEPVGVFTDIYALGVILYELLAGRKPFDLSNRTPGESERLIIEWVPQKPSIEGSRLLTGTKGAWADLDVLCLTAMHKDPRRRYASAEALIRDVDHYLNAQPLDARPDTFQYKLGKFLIRHRRAVTAATLAATTIIALVAFFTIRLAAARDSALAAASRTNRIQRFMLNLFEGGDKSAGPADDLRVVTLVDRGVQEAQSLHAEPAVQAELYHTLATLYQRLGKFDQADSLLNSALKQRQSLHGPDHPDVAASLTALGILRVDQARLEEAEKLVREALEKVRRLRPPDRRKLAESTAALGEVLQARGAYDKAIPVLEEAVSLHSTLGSPTPELSTTLSELANTHFYAGHYDVSESLNQRVLAMNRQLFGERHPFVADDLINLGAIQFERGRYPEAEKYYRQGLEITQAWYGKDHPKTAGNLTMLGRVLVMQGRYDEAVDIVQQALAVRERIYGPDHPRVASVVNELGTMALRRGKLDEAEAHFRRMADIYKAAYNDNHYLVALAISNWASVYLDKKDFARAEKMFREAVDCYTRTLSADHLNTGIARIKLGRALLGQRRYREAEGEIVAGYNILTKQTSPSVSWLRSARQDLVTIYEALKQPDKANAFRAELASTAGSKP